MTQQPVLVTSALPYVNNIPHLGNIVGSTLSADVYTRFLRLQGKKVFYLCGSDEYGTTTEVKAKAEKLSCREICDRYHQIHRDVYDWFNIQFDVYGRTSTSTQTSTTHEIFFDLLRNRHIESRTIDQMYCNSCEMFLADRYLQGYCYFDSCRDLKKIANGDQCDGCGNLMDCFKFSDYWCLVCHQKPEIRQTKHLYLKLADFKADLIKYFLESDIRLTSNARAITQAFLNQELESRCITRDLRWGTPVPSNQEFKQYLDENGFESNNSINLDEFK